MASEPLVSDDGAVQTILSALDTHTSFMSNIQGTVDQIKGDIARVYIADSSTTYQSKVNDWIEAYRAVGQAVQDLRTGLTDAHGAVNKGVTDAVHISSGWTPSNDYYTALTPHS